MSKQAGIIYMAQNRRTGEVYVGLTTRTFEMRKAEHITGLGKCADSNIHRAILEHGENAFDWRILEENIPHEDLPASEVAWIAIYNAKQCGYNATFGGELGGGGFGKRGPRSERATAKQKETIANRTPEEQAAISAKLSAANQRRNEQRLAEREKRWKEDGIDENSSIEDIMKSENCGERHARGIRKTYFGVTDADKRKAERREKVRTMRLQGMSILQIAKALGVSRGTIRRDMRAIDEEHMSRHRS